MLWSLANEGMLNKKLVKINKHGVPIHSPFDFHGWGSFIALLKYLCSGYGLSSSSINCWFCSCCCLAFYSYGTD
ncbi:hypothetical protein ACXOJ3_01100 [Streptococcus thermophilus]